MILYTIVLFYFLSPGILFRFPKKGKYLIALTHSILFAVLFHFVRKWIYSPEGFQTQDLGQRCIKHDDCKSKFCSSCIGYDCSQNTVRGKCLIKKDVPDGDPCLNDTDCSSGWCSVCNGSPCKIVGANEIRKPATGKCLKRTDMTYVTPGSVKSVDDNNISSTASSSSCVFNSDCASFNCSARGEEGTASVVCDLKPESIPTGITKAIFDKWNGGGVGKSIMRSGLQCQAINTKFARIKGVCMAVAKGKKCASSVGCIKNYCKNNTCADPDGLTDSPCLKNDDCKSKSCLNIRPKQNLGYQAYSLGPGKSATYNFGFCK